MDQSLRTAGRFDTHTYQDKAVNVAGSYGAVYEGYEP